MRLPKEKAEIRHWNQLLGDGGEKDPAAAKKLGGRFKSSR